MKNVLFVCVGNSCRSQMAEGFARAWGAKVMKATSAGTAALGQVSPEVIEAMKQEGIDISGQNSQQLTREMMEKSDLIVVLGGDPEPLYPDLLKGKTIHWSIPDPFGQPPSQIRKVRGMLKAKVMDLIIDLSKNRPKPREVP